MNKNKILYQILLITITFIIITIIQIIDDPNNFGLDYRIYQIIYGIKIDFLWTINTGFYYSPFFAILFYPFYIIGFKIYYILLFITIIIIHYLSIINNKYEIIITLDAFIYNYLYYGNIDIFILFLIILMRLSYIKHKWHGLIIGFLLFKPSVILIILFFGLDRKKIDIQYWLTLLPGLIFNYIFFLFRQDLIEPFLIQISFQNFTGAIPSIFYRYPWFLWTIIDFIQWKIIQSKQRKYLIKREWGNKSPIRDTK